MQKGLSQFQHYKNQLNEESSDEDANKKALKYLKSKQKKIDEEDEYSDSFETLNPSTEYQAKDQ